MNVISNSCLGGFIYRDILKTEYKNPFIWTAFDNDDFINFIDNFENINFSNVMIDKKGKELKNNFITVIDDKYRLRNGHIYFSLNDSTPKIKGNDVYYNRPWEYILEKYNSRLKRMNEEIIIAFYEPTNATVEQINKLIEICKKHKYKCLIVTEKQINTDYAKIIKFKRSKVKDWHIELENQCSEEIKNFLENK